MKKLKLFVMSIVAMFVAVLGVSAAECREVAVGNEVAEVEGKFCDTLDDAFAAVPVKGTVKLLDDITESSKQYIFVGVSVDRGVSPKEMTIDFNTHTLTLSGNTLMGLLVYAPATLKNGSIISSANPSSSGKASAVVLGSKANLTLENMKVESTTGYGINAQSGNTSLTLDKDSEVKTSEVAAIIGHGENAHHTFNIYGTVTNTKTYSALEGQYQVIGDVNINVFDGAKVSSANGAGILEMSQGTVTINGGEVSGYSGIVMTRGNLDVIGGTIKGTGDYREFEGTSKLHVQDNGAAIYLEPTTADMKVDIKGGNLISEKSYAISAPKNNDNGVANQKLTLTIENGTFESAKGGIELKDAEDNVRAAFISDGAVFLKNGEPDTSVLTYAKEGLDISDNGVVGVIHKIEVVTPTHGTVTAPANAAEGEEVTITATPNSGYRLSSLVVKTADGETVTVTDNKFIMPAGDATITATFRKISSSTGTGTNNEPTEEKTEIVVEEPAGDKEVTVSTETNEVLKESLTNTTDEKLQALLENKDVTVELEVNDVKKEDVAEEVVEKFESVVKGSTIAEFFDLDILVKAGEQTEYLTELSKPITITIDLPELPEVEEGYVRTYYILREHEGVYEKLNAKLTEDGKLSFATDKFSKYAIAYVDEKGNPNTGDNIVNSIAMGIISLVGLAGCGLYLNKKQLQK